MKPQLSKLLTDARQSFSIRQDLSPDVNNKWHYHVEIELLHFKKGTGTQFVGDSIKRFQPGDVILLGSELPHITSFDDVFYDDNKSSDVDIRVIHFDPHFLGEVFFNLPEVKTIKGLLDLAKRGIKVGGEAGEAVAELMESMLKCEGVDRITSLLRVLHEIAESPDNIILSSASFKNEFKESERINEIYAFTFENFKRKIALEEVADLANMTTTSFCRYFRSETGKTYSQFILELKIGYACKLLIENNMNVKQVCFESGFNNSASFHKYFKIITGKSPQSYQSMFLNKNRVISMYRDDFMAYKKAR